jgi:hypothetical protein
VLLLAVPWLDMKLAPRQQGQLLNAIGAGVLLYVVVMTLMGYFA